MARCLALCVESLFIHECPITNNIINDLFLTAKYTSLIRINVKKILNGNAKVSSLRPKFAYAFLCHYKKQGFSNCPLIINLISLDGMMVIYLLYSLQYHS